jgi:hypothetical protein
MFNSKLINLRIFKLKLAVKAELNNILIEKIINTLNSLRLKPLVYNLTILKMKK